MVAAVKNGAQMATNSTKWDITLLSDGSFRFHLKGKGYARENHGRISMEEKTSNSEWLIK